MKYIPRKGALLTGTDIKATHLASGGYWGRKLYKIEQPIIYQGRDGHVYATPSGFICDLASVPWRRRNPLYDLGAIPHDFGYKFGFIYRVDLEAGTVERARLMRRQIDAMFSDINYTAGQPKFWAKVFYRVVRMFSKRTWKRYRKKDYQYDKTNEEAAALICTDKIV